MANFACQLFGAGLVLYSGFINWKKQLEDAGSKVNKNNETERGQ